jgi:hypothetical protein
MGIGDWLIGDWLLGIGDWLIGYWGLGIRDWLNIVAYFILM